MKKRQLLMSLLLVLFVVFFVGCAGIGQKTSEYGEKVFRSMHKTPTESDKLSAPYRHIVLGQSTSADFLENTVVSATETISQSESIVGVFGRDQKRQRAWFNMVVFDEDTLVAVRKYFLTTYDRPKEWFYLKEKLRFDTEMYINRAILDDGYANADAKRIAILKQIRDTYNSDIVVLQKYNRDMANIGMLVNQSLNVVLTELKQNPSYAEKMEFEGGLDFDHPTLNKGKIRIVIDDKTALVKLKIKIGSIVDSWNSQSDVIDMDKGIK